MVEKYNKLLKKNRAKNEHFFVLLKQQKFVWRTNERTKREIVKHNT